MTKDAVLHVNFLIISAIAVALKQCLTNEFKSYASQVIKNAQALALALSLKGYKLVTGILTPTGVAFHFVFFFNFWGKPRKCGN